LFFVLEKRKLLGFYRLFFGGHRPLDAATAAALVPPEPVSAGGRQDI
jgi:hypothetical protein